MDSTPGHAEPRGHAVWRTSTDGQATYVASWWIRFFASLIDAVLIFAGAAAIFAIGAALDNDMSWTVAGLGAATVYFLYHPLLVAFNHGQTLGKKLLAVKVVNNDGSSTGFGRAFVREVLFKLVPSALSPLNLIDYLWAAFREDRRTLHDLGAGTAVVEDNTPSKKSRLAGDDRGSWRCTLCGSETSGASCSACGATP
jgi:uncharacterized RDD family membrane protein YckC